MNDAPVRFGTATFRNQSYDIQLAAADRLRHMYAIGKTGVGKSTLYQNMMLHDIAAGAGCCFVDPHGEAIDWLLENIPEERLDDVIVFDPSDTAWPISLNLLEGGDEQENDFLVAEAIEIFYKLFDPGRTGLMGPQFEHWMRNAALTVMADPAGGSLIEIPRLFTDQEFELAKRRHVTDKVVVAFWEQQMAKTAQFHRSEMLNYFTSKFGRFMTNTLMRNIIGQKVSGLSLPQVVAGQKILLVNLSKGSLGELNSYMLGLIVMVKLQAAILARSAIAPAERLPFFLFVDEFQNVMTDAFIGMLAEARKYGLAVHLTNQYVAQLEDDIREAVLGNVGTLVTFQIGAHDAAALLPELEARPRETTERGHLTEEHLQRLPRHDFYIRLLMSGTAYPAFRGTSLPPQTLATDVQPEHVRAVSRLRHGQPRALVERRLARTAPVPAMAQ